MLAGFMSGRSVKPEIDRHQCGAIRIGVGCCQSRDCAMTATQCRTISMTLAPYGAEGLLGVPATSPRDIVLFAHGSGSRRRSPRNTFVAQALQRTGFATLLFDLLTEDEAADRANVFNIRLLADRLDQAATWSRQIAANEGLPPGFFGASTGAAAALVAAAARRDVGAIVSRGGRPDLAGDVLHKITAATLLVIGDHDPEVLPLNQAAPRKFRCECQLEVISGAPHMCDESGALEAVVALARTWFLRHLAVGPMEKQHAVP
jgi:pimeloyl-ACP methyl ester carboxylesterase